MQSEASTTEQTDKERRDREKVLALFLSLLLLTKKRLLASVTAFLFGTLNAEDLSANLITILTVAHQQATGLGRRLGGGSQLHETTNLHFAIAVMTTQIGPLSRLVAELRRGKWAVGPDGELPAGLRNRLLLYVKRVRGSGEEAWLRALPGDTLIYWELDPAEANHCPDCPVLAAGSPYRADSLPTTPSAGDTKCITACRCVLKTADGEECFAMPEEL